MKTIYIDVYYMINFTVDILAIFVACRMVCLQTRIRQIVLGGCVGACLAIFELFIESDLLNLLLGIVFVLVLYRVFCKRLSVGRGVKFLIAFYISSFLISGIVNYIYGVLDKYIGNIIPAYSDTTNRKAIIFSLIILLIIGAIRVFIMMISDSMNIKSTRLMIEIEDKSLEVDALIDTGNLVKDPMNMNPVIFLKRSYAESILPRSVIELSDLDNLKSDFRKRIRLIPVTRNSETHVMTGVRVDKVLVCKDKYREEINATVVIDKEEGTFGGYYALAPYVAVCNHA